MTNDQTQVVQRFAKSLRIPTVSHVDYSQTDFSVYEKFIDFLKQDFPKFHKACQLERVNQYSLLYLWPGKNSKLEPLVMMAHYDVVPVEKPETWQHPPFSGELVDGYVWGRGALDVKCQLIMYLEAVERLIDQKFKPERDIYFAFGHDEEVGGDQGASEIVKLFTERKMKFAGVIDEGGLIVTGAVKQVKSPLAMIGVAEKGMSNYTISIEAPGGHSSMPPKTTALGQLSQMIERIEKHPMPAHLTPPVQSFLKNIAPEMGGVAKIAIQNQGLLGGILKKFLSKTPETNAMIRTTFAPTTIKGSESHNILPLLATLNLNVRLLNGDTGQSVADYLQKLAGDIPVQIEQTQINEASPESPESGMFYDAITQTIREFFPEAIVTPYLMVGGTDSRKYSNLTQYIYRFCPIQITNEEKNTIHNTNERLAIDSFAKCVDWMEAFLKVVSSQLSVVSNQ